MRVSNLEKKHSSVSSIRGLYFMLNWSTLILNLLLVSSLVRQSAAMFSVLQCFNLITSFSASSHMWWYYISIYLILMWNSKFFTRVRELWLLSTNIIAFNSQLLLILINLFIISWNWSLWRKLHIQTVIFSKLDRLMYSVSVMNVAVILCLQLYHMNASSSDRKAALLIECQSAQSSVYAESE